MMSQNIEALRNFYLRFKHECYVACGIAVFGVVYFYPLNRNLLYLSFLGVTYVMSSILFTRFRTMLVALAVFAVLAAVPADVPRATFINPREDRIDINGDYYAQPKPSETWLYVFQVTDLEKYQRECGGNLQGNLLIDGAEISGFEVRVGENDIPTDTIPYTHPKKSWEQLSLPLEGDLSGNFKVSLRLKPGASSGVYTGPETHEFNIYSDAVWLEFKNEQCSVLYHAKRRSIPAQ